MDSALTALPGLALLLVAAMPMYGPPAQAVSDQPGRLLHGITMQFIWLVADVERFAPKLCVARCALNTSIQREALRDATPELLNARIGVGARAVSWLTRGRVAAKEDCFGECIGSLADGLVGSRIFFCNDERDAERYYILHVRA